MKMLLLYIFYIDQLPNLSYITRISVLDVAGPCFEGSRRDIRIKDKKWGLTSASANFVDNYTLQ